MSSPVLTFSSHWSLLGPFPLGTREAAWGADPLEHPRYAGFSNLLPDKASEVPSALAFNGTVGWSETPLRIVSPSSANPRSWQSSFDLAISTSFPSIPFAALRSIYGWSASQYQVWARVNITLNGKRARQVLFWTGGVLEFRIDGREFFGGDFFELRNSPGAIVELQPGEHVLEIRWVRDVRSMGGIGEPALKGGLTLEVRDEEAAVVVEEAVVPDFLNGTGFAGEVLAVKVRNQGRHAVEIVGVEARASDIRVELWSRVQTLRVEADQTREIAVRISATRDATARSNSLPLDVRLRSSGSSKDEWTVPIEINSTTRNISDPHKFTFLHPSGAVSYAILEPPGEQEVKSSGINLPVLMNLHGAGLEVDSDEVRSIFKSLKPLPFWVVHPSGMTPWSADDWHSWGFADAEAAVEAIQDWIRITNWQGPGARTDKIFVVGHSNGGQGTWYTLTHRPDRIIAAAAVSGYTSIESYVPYQFWSVAEPAAAAILGCGRLSYRHELLVDNFAGIPITQQHGSADDNVPPSHSRQIFQLASQAGSTPNFLEIPDTQHWYPGIMETNHLKEFYSKIKTGNPDPKLPERFTVVASPNGETGSRGGLTIEQLRSPSQLGKLEVRRKDHRWDIVAHNVRSLSFNFSAASSTISTLSVAEQDFDIEPKVAASGKTGYQSGDNVFVQSKEGTWSRLEDSTALQVGRTRSQMGGMDALLRTNSTILIQYHDHETLDVAKSIANNLYQYFRADVEIQHASTQTAQTHNGNAIQVLVGGEPASWNSGAVTLTNGSVRLTKADGHVSEFVYRPQISMYFLTPLDDGRVRLMVWGRQLDGLRRISRLLPTTTGVGQPDFVLLDKDASWKGANGALAMGFFNYDWTISSGSFFS